MQSIPSGWWHVGNCRESLVCPNGSFAYIAVLLGGRVCMCPLTNGSRNSTKQTKKPTNMTNAMHTANRLDQPSYYDFDLCLLLRPPSKTIIDGDYARKHAFFFQCRVGQYYLGHILVLVSCNYSRSVRPRKSLSSTR